MKISFLDTIKNSPQIFSNKVSSNNKGHSAPISFGHAEDIFEFGDLEVNTLGIDKNKLKQNVDVKGTQYFLSNQLDGYIRNDFSKFSMKVQGKNSDGTYNNFPFYLKFGKSLTSKYNKPYYNVIGSVYCSGFGMQDASFGDKTFIEGIYEDKPFYLRAFDAEDFSHIKGKIGNENIELVIRRDGALKEVEGRIDGKEFAFSQGKSIISGGTETSSPLLPVLIAIADRREFKPITSETKYDDEIYKESGENEYIDRNNFF